MNYFLSAQKINPQIKLPAPSVENENHTFNHYQTVREQYAQNKHLTHTQVSLVNTLPPGDPPLRGGGTFFFVLLWLL